MSEQPVPSTTLEVTDATPETNPVLNTVVVSDAVAPEPAAPAEPKEVVERADGLVIASY